MSPLYFFIIVFMLIQMFYDDALTELVNQYANRAIVVSCSRIALKSRVNVCAQRKMHLSPHGSLLATDHSKAVVLV